ncbi:MAG: Holliday junction resolvase RuvX [Fibrobacterota bacterium]
MKYLSIDYGLRRIGVAVSDPLGIIARPLTTIDRKYEDTFERFRTILAEEEPDALIFGLPLDADDRETEMCTKVRSFADRFYDKLTPDIPCEFYDESYSSVTTQEIMLKTSTRKKRRNKKNIDRIAAAVFLEEYLRGQQ